MPPCSSNVMNPEAIFEAWAPAESLWSPWVKPVLFAAMDAPVSVHPMSPALSLKGIPPAADTVLVLDFPSAEGVITGLALARNGYRPVPLFNALPRPNLADASAVAGEPVAVDLRPIISALSQSADPLTALELPVDAPPAFLLDSRRRGTGPLEPGWFDNRSVSFTTDFPSAEQLIAHGYRRVILFQHGSHQPQPDLAHTLLFWQEAGLAIEALRPGVDLRPHLCLLQRPTVFRRACHTVLESLGVKRHELAPFTGLLADPSAG
jgi:hypothetical protein